MLFFFSIFAMKPLLSPNSFTKSDGFCRALGNICPSPPATKHLLSETSRAKTRVQRGTGDPGHIRRDLGLWLRPGGLWLAKRSPQAMLFGLIPFPPLQLLQQSPHHAVSDTEPSH